VKRLLYASVVLLLFGCAQDGDVTVENRSGPYLEVSMDGSTYLLDDGEVVTKRVDIGRTFIFGPDDRPLTVAGEGECKFPFSEVVLVEDERNTLVTIYGDAGYVDICNQTGRTLELYLTPCADASWSDPLEMILDGYCTTWMVEEGCWDMLAVSLEGEFEDYGIRVLPCDVVEYDLLPPALATVKGSSPLKAMPARDGKADLRKKKTSERAVK
jgi:hypothetical protein